LGKGAICPEGTAVKKLDETSNLNPETAAYQYSTQCTNEVLMKTLLVKVQSTESSQPQTVRLLFDEGSQRSSITSSLVKQLRSQPVGEDVSRDVLADGSVTPFRKTFRHNVTITGIDGKGKM
jgi:hypothetical protein